jgi:SpoVK/Ycf46/Vps4 family AAA+-type ATPase
LRDIRDLTTLIRSRVSLVLLETREELRAIELLRQVAAETDQPLFKWSITEGLLRLEEGYRPQRHNLRPQDVLGHLKAGAIPGIYLLLDFHPYLEDAPTVRLLKETILAAEEKQQTLILLSYRLELAPELEHLSARYQLAPPDAERLKQIIREEISHWTREHRGEQPRVEKAVLPALLRNLTGLSISEARRLTRRALHDDGALTHGDLDVIIRKKVELLGRNGVLSLEPDTARFADVGGLANLKGWLKKRRSAFLGAQSTPGLPTPKGILLLGVQGCGKSLAAKAVAGMWKIPLLRLDFGSVYNKYHGETERNIRESLQAADALAPCVLWLDELEKGIAGGNDESGTSRRVLGTLLTWMAERPEGVFLVATANDITALPPELIRKGRLDETFFVDLPEKQIREEIFSIHLKKRRLDPKTFGLEALAAASNGFSGAELEQAVVAGLYSALGGSGKLNQDMLLQELASTRPLSVVMSEQINALRRWAADRTVPAD